MTDAAKSPGDAGPRTSGAASGPGVRRWVGSGQFRGARSSGGPAPTGRSWPIGRIFGAVAGTAALLAVLAVVVGALVLNRLTDARSALLDHIAPAQLAGQRLSTALVDQETGVRGFALAGRAEFLEPYLRGQDGEREAVQALRGFAAQRDTGQLGGDLDAVEAAVDAWRGGFAEPAIRAARTAGLPLDGVRGRALFDQVRTVTSTLLAHLDAERTAGRARLTAAAGFVSGVGVVITVVLMVFLVAAGLTLRAVVLRPISRLAAQVRGVVSGSGDVGQAIAGRGPREIVELGEDVDAMRLHILHELDAQHDVNRRLDEQARDLERSNRDLEQFAYVASHDLQEPLRKVSSFCQLLQRRYGGHLDDRADQYIGFAVDGAQRMQRLINDLLAFSRVGRGTAEFVPVALGQVARIGAGQQESVRVEAAGEIVVGELPEVCADPALLAQLFANLVGNALKFRRAGVPPVVRITAAPAADPADGWEIAVADNGIGIEPEYADKVFVIFQRLHARDVYTGTGIGLALAKKIVEFHGGRIWVDTAERIGPGTVIRFTLPAERTLCRATSTAAEAAEEERASHV